MPSKTVKQAKFMSAVAHDWHPSGLDIPVKVAEEFHEADKGHKYGAKADGGTVDDPPTGKGGSLSKDPDIGERFARAVSGGRNLGERALYNTTRAGLYNSNTATPTGHPYGGLLPSLNQRRTSDMLDAESISDKVRGRAFGGVSPMMPQMSNPGGIASQAFNPVMPNNNLAAMPGANPATMGNNNPAMQPMQQPMPQPPINAQAMGVAPSAMGMPQMGMNAPAPGLNGGMPGPAGARPFALGGGVTPKPLPMDHTNTFKGPIVSRVPGRTDLHSTKVPSGSFVIPADIVSAHGQGNTLAGMDTLQKLFKMGPHANPSSIPSTINAIHRRAKGGGTERHMGKPVEVRLAGGEIVVPPENVHETMERICKKKLSLDECHKAMDAWVLKQRKKLRKTLAKLPGPARD